VNVANVVAQAAYERVMQRVADQPIVTEHSVHTKSMRSKKMHDAQAQKEVGPEEIHARMCKQIRLLYRRHLLRHAKDHKQKDDGAGAMGGFTDHVADADADEDAAAGAGAPAGASESRFIDLLEDWLDALPLAIPIPDTAAPPAAAAAAVAAPRPASASAGDNPYAPRDASQMMGAVFDFDFEAAVPRGTWNLYYAVLSDRECYEDDGAFLSMMRRAWGIRIGASSQTDLMLSTEEASSKNATGRLGKRILALWEREQGLRRIGNQLKRGAENASEELKARNTELAGLSELCLTMQELRVAPAALGSLKQLRMLHMDRNLLREVPDEVAQLEKLTDLVLDRNKLTKFAEPRLANRLTALRRLSLRSNRLAMPKSALGSELSGMAKLVELDLSRNKLPELPQALTSLVKLRCLNMEHNHLYGLPPRILECLSSMQELRLNDNDLTILPDEIGNLKRLKLLTLHENALVRLPQSVRELQDLSTLTLHRNCLDMRTTSEASEWPRMAGMTNLEAVTFQCNELNSLPRSLFGFRQLKDLCLRDNLFVKFPDDMKSLVNCVNLDLSHNRLRAPFELTDLLSDGFLKYEKRIAKYFAARGGIHEFMTCELAENDLDEIGIPPKHRMRFRSTRNEWRDRYPKYQFVDNVAQVSCAARACISAIDASHPSLLI
jgi:Leucine-rich repeat (LRR) protein